MKRTVKRALWGSLLGFLALAGMAAWYIDRSGLIERVYVYQDGGARLRLDGASSLRKILWSPPQEIPDGKAAPNPAPQSPAWSSPVLVVHAAKSDRGDHDLVVRELAATGWSASTPIAALSTRSDEVSPELSPDGNLLYFASNRPGGLGGFDLYVSRRGPDGWDKPVNLGAGVNSPYDETSPAFHPTGAILVFTTNRPRGFLLAPPPEWADVPLESWKAGAPQLACVSRTLKPGEVSKWSDLRPLAAIASGASDQDACFSPRGELLYFASARGGGAGGFDIYRAQCRLDGDPSVGPPALVVAAPENAGLPLNSRFDDVAPRVFLDGHAMLLTVIDPQGDVSGLVESRTREVEAEVEISAVPLRALGENALKLGAFVISGAVLVIATILLYRHHRVWSANLLLRSTVVALMAHAAMLYGFYFWILSDDIVALAAREGPVREITVERVLQAKLTGETLRMDVAALSKEAETQPPSPAAIRAPERTLEAAAESDLAPLAVAVPAGSSSAPPLISAAPGPIARAVRDGSVPLPAAGTSLSATPVAAALPRPQPAPAAQDPFDLPLPDGRSLKAATDLPRPGPMGTVVSSAASAGQVGDAEIAPAETQTHAPVGASPSLPAVARHAPEAPALVTPLAVPAQSTAPGLDADSGAPIPSPRATAGRVDAVASALTAAGPPRARVTEPLSAESPWRTPAAGFLPSIDGIAEARELPRATLAPAPVVSAAPAVQGAALKLPEAVPVGEVASAGHDSAGDPLPRPGQRTLTLSGPVAGRVAAELASVVSRPASGPLTTPSSALDAPAEASAARLGSTPQPGVLRDTALPRLERTAYNAQKTVLPEGDGGTPQGKGAPEVADVLAPRAAAKREWRPTLPQPPSLAGTEPETAPAAPLAPRAEPLAVADAGSAPRPPLAAMSGLSPPGASDERLVSSVQHKLPEAPPELRGERDLRRVRSREGRQVLVGQMGGTRGSEDAVGLALRWLAAHQSPDGRWDIDGFDEQCQGCRSPGVQVDCDAAVTGLALLCFLGQNHTPNNPESTYGRQARNAIRWLVKNQAPNGSLAGPDDAFTMYTHGIATLALSEALVLTRDKSLEDPVRRAVDLILKAQNKTTGGWRYQPRPPIRGDTSVTGWQVLALVSARGAGITVPEVVLDRARHWLDNEVAGGQHGGIYGYTHPGEPRVAMAAEGMYARLLLGARRTDRNIEEAARYIHTETRGGGYLDNLYLLYYGNLALYHYQGWIWERWNAEVREFLVRSQHKSGTLAGSWDPTGPYTETGGRVLATCFAALTLEVYYRYLPLYWTLDKPQDASRPSGGD